MAAPEPAAVTLADAFGALGVADPWRSRFDSWALARGLSAELRRAVVVELLRRRVFHAAEAGTRRAAQKRGRR